MAWRRAMTATTAVCVLAAGCTTHDGVNLGTLRVGAYSTAVRTISDQPSLPNGTVLEAIRLSDAVADTSQFDSSLSYLWQAEPITDTAGIAPIVGEAGTRIAERLGWVAGFRAQYADTPRSPGGAAAPSAVALSITLLRFPDDTAARRAAAAFETTNWTDLGNTVAAPLPMHRDTAARYTPGGGKLLLDTSMGPFVLRLRLDAPSDGIDKRIGELDAVLDEEHTLLQSFAVTPVAEISSLPRDPGGLLARMVATDPVHQPAPSPEFAVYGATGALRDQSPAMRRDRLYEKWGVEALAVSGGQHLYRLRDNRAAKDMAAAFGADSTGQGRPIDGDPNLPDTQCHQPDQGAPACRMVVDSFYTEVHADTTSSLAEKAAAQYVLLATA